MIHIIGKRLIGGRLYSVLRCNGPTEYRFVEHLFLPWNRLATLVMFDSEPKHLLRRNQVGNSESNVIKSQADNVKDDTE
jgi:hypothetical protein